MTTLGPEQASCSVFTFKEGLLSPIAHDLELSVENFEIRRDEGDAISATFDSDSLRVLHAMKDGSPTASLGEGDKATIGKTIKSDVLKSAPISFTSSSVLVSGDSAQVQGTLRIGNASQPLSVQAKREGARWVAEITVHQPDFGIKPYRAMMGALRIKPDVRVRVTLPA